MLDINIFFWALSIVGIIAALMVIFSNNPINSVLWLVVLFFSISGHYILLNAQFLAIVNIIVYAGAIMVLFLFVVMLMNPTKEKDISKNSILQLLGFFAGGSFLLALISFIKGSLELDKKTISINDSPIGLIDHLGKALFSDFVLPFELSSVLFLSAMVGAIVLGKKE